MLIFLDLLLVFLDHSLKLILVFSEFFIRLLFLGAEVLEIAGVIAFDPFDMLLEDLGV